MTIAYTAEFKTESVRKSIHFLIALSPGLAALNYQLAIFSLTTGILSYAVMEQLRLSGVKVPLVSAITCMAC